MNWDGNITDFSSFGPQAEFTAPGRTILTTDLQYVTRDSEKMSCHFDSVVVSTDRAPAPTEVPALSDLGLLILASVLVMAAFVFLRRPPTG